MMSKWGVGIDNFLLFGQASSLWCWGRYKSSVSMYVDMYPIMTIVKSTIFSIDLLST